MNMENGNVGYTPFGAESMNVNTNKNSSSVSIMLSVIALLVAISGLGLASYNMVMNPGAKLKAELVSKTDYEQLKTKLNEVESKLLNTNKENVANQEANKEKENVAKIDEEKMSYILAKKALLAVSEDYSKNTKKYIDQENRFGMQAFEAEFLKINKEEEQKNKIKESKWKAVIEGTKIVVGKISGENIDKQKPYYTIEVTQTDLVITENAKNAEGKEEAKKVTKEELEKEEKELLNSSQKQTSEEANKANISNINEAINNLNNIVTQN